MKKIGIITINDYSNYGNRLQNYATQLFLENIGYSAYTIRNEANTLKESEKRVLTKIRERGVKNSMLLISNKLRRKGTKELLSKKISRFKEFSREYINETDFLLTEDNIPKDINEKFDFFVTGSDQVWNPHYRYGSSIDFLTFASQEKRIAFSPSFGVSNIPLEYQESYTKWLSEMKGLSVREEAGAKIIGKLTGRNSEVLVDPTLLITKKEWLKVSKSPDFKPVNNYILTYFLGNQGKIIKNQVNKFAKKNNLSVINLLDIKDKDAYIADPSEFIDLINSASLVLTDSFHGTIFSIIMKKPFIVFDRVENNNISMSSRIDTLLKKFNLNNRYYKNIDSNDEVFITNYDHVEEILRSERQKTVNYLNKVFYN